MVFSRFLSMTIFISAENTRHSEKPGQNPAGHCEWTLVDKWSFDRKSIVWIQGPFINVLVINTFLLHLAYPPPPLTTSDEMMHSWSWRNSKRKTQSTKCVNKFCVVSFFCPILFCVLPFSCITYWLTALLLCSGNCTYLPLKLRMDLWYHCQDWSIMQW
jgi:hypothetical protein